MGAASGGGGRQLLVQEGCTRWHGARGGDGEFGGGRGGATRWLNGGENGGTVGAMGGGGRKEAPRWGWVPYITARGGGWRAARWKNQGRGNGGGGAVGVARRWQKSAAPCGGRSLDSGARSETDHDR
jgi:hypothetical protein